MSNRKGSSSTDRIIQTNKLSLVPNKNELPLHWRCVNEVNIEKRLETSHDFSSLVERRHRKECSAKYFGRNQFMFQTWKFDVQCQIANMGKRLDKITREHELDDLGGFALRSADKQNEHDQLSKQMKEEYRKQGVTVGGISCGLAKAKFN